MTISAPAYPPTQPLVLVALHSSEGQTAKIADFLSDKLRAKGAVVDVRPVESAPSPAGFTAVVLGDSIHMSRHSEELLQYLGLYADDLKATPSALFQVSLTSIDTDLEHADKAHTLVRQLLEETGFAPDAVGLFAGALAYTSYGWLKRRMVRAIAKKSGLDTDTSHDHEYTDWDAVEQFADDVFALATAADTRPVGTGTAGS